MFNKKTLLGVDVLTAIGSMTHGTLVTTLTLAERFSLSVSHVESILRPLRDAGLIRSVRGPGGGYYIARSPERINIWEVICAMESDEAPEISSADLTRATTTLEQALALEVKSFLAKKTIAEFLSTDSTWNIQPVHARIGLRLGPKPASLMPIAPNSVFQLSSFMPGVLT